MAAWQEEIDSWTQWPAWFPNKELGHRHLRALEHYLLSRSRIIDEGGYGIDLADYAASFGATFNRDAEQQFWSITVGQLRAVTPSGQPIWLNGQRASFDLMQERSVDGHEVFIPGAKIDIYLLPNDEDEFPGASDGEQKFRLKVLPAPLNDAPAPEGHDLYLGRHTLQEDGLKLERRPIVRRLCALGPIDEDWEEWTKDLWSRIDALRERHCGPAAGRSAASALLSAEILDVNREWPFLTIPALVRSLVRINCLQENPGARLFHLVAALREGQMEGWTGQELPKTLAQLLPEPAKAAAVEPARTDFPATYQLLIEALSEKIEFHAPIGYFNRWYTGLENYGEAGPADGEKRQIESIAMDAPNDWVKAVLLITRMVLGKGERAAEVSGHLDRMYTALNKKAGPAAPMAFFWLVKTATLVANFPQGASNNLNAYCQVIKGGRMAVADRLTRYIDRVRKEPGKESIQYFYLFGSGKRATAGAAVSADVHCMILGDQGSGKTALESALHESWAATGAGGRLYVDKTTPSEGFHSGSAADLLILTVAPRETDRWVLDGLRTAASEIMRSSPAARVAVAYTKADEYGVVELTNIRLARSGQSPGKTQREFDQFAGGRQEVAVKTQKLYGGHEIPTPEGVVTASGTTRSHILSNTAQIWMDVISAGRLLNGYFIAASPAGAPDEYLAKNIERTGVMQLLGDFIEYRRSA